MRITCPGCGSAYEVPDRAVPDPGRDVQCAACGASWFILKGGPAAQGTERGPQGAGRDRAAAFTAPAGDASGPRAGSGLPGRDGAGGTSAGVATPVPPRTAAVAREAGARDDGGQAGAAVPPDALPEGLPDGLPRPRVDPEVLAILRAEAETERRARQRDALPRSPGIASPAAKGTAAQPDPDPGPGARSGAGAPHHSPPAARAPGPRAGTAPAMPVAPSDAASRTRNAEPGPRARDNAAATQADRFATPWPPPQATVGRTEADAGFDAAPKATAPPAQPGSAHDRLARLTAAERRVPAAASVLPGSARGAGGDDADPGLIEDPDPARHQPRPPLLDAPGGNDRTDAEPTSFAQRLPVAVVPAERQALVVLQQRRRGFRLGFAATAGLCCAALAVYLGALHAGDRLDGPLSEAVLTRGAQVQATLVDWLRRVVVPALS